MAFVTILFIAAALAMDAFAVSISCGITIPQMRLRYALLLATVFGGFQALMPLAGWLIGSEIRTWIVAWDHWIACALLVAVGGKLILEACSGDADCVHHNPLNGWVLLVLAIATSIDAFAVGLTFSFIALEIIRPAVIIGVVTFALSFLGAYAGTACGRFMKKRIEIAAGLLLIAIGIKIVIDHTLGSGSMPG
ncbi:manganese efflux pump [bacterium]|nr:manganese efflux pump [candidate division CSSED10-310 bacterium]